MAHMIVKMNGRVKAIRSVLPNIKRYDLADILTSEYVNCRNWRDCDSTEFAVFQAVHDVLYKYVTFITAADEAGLTDLTDHAAWRKSTKVQHWESI